METSEIRRNWQEERDSAELYRALARLERSPQLSRLFAKLAASESEHAAAWEQRLQVLGQGLPEHRVSLRTRVLIALARRLGVPFVVPSIAARELADRDRYAGLSDADLAELSKEERGHAAVMRMLGAGRGAAGGHGAGALRLSSNLRAAILGATDGVASNFCLILGVAGGGAPPRTILLTGVAGLIAGACSMALGEWLSVTNTRELARSQIDRELEEAQSAPQWAHEQLALIYETKGLGEEEAALAAQRVLAAGPQAVAALIREELMIDAPQLAVSPSAAAAASFCLFAVGALVPVLPYFLASASSLTLGASTGLALLALFVLGLATSLFNARPALFSGLRQMLIGAAAAALTYLVGRAFGAALS